MAHPLDGAPRKDDIIGMILPAKKNYARTGNKESVEESALEKCKRLERTMLKTQIIMVQWREG